MKKTSINQQEIIKTFKEMGCSVIDNSEKTDSYPEIIIGINQKTILVHIKQMQDCVYSSIHSAFMANWNGATIAMIDSIDAATRLVNLLKKG